MRIFSFVFSILVFIINIFIVTPIVTQSECLRRDSSFNCFSIIEFITRDEHYPKVNKSAPLSERIGQRIYYGIEKGTICACQVALASCAVCGTYPNRFCSVKYVALLGLLSALGKHMPYSLKELARAMLYTHS